MAKQICGLTWQNPNNILHPLNQMHHQEEEQDLDILVDGADNKTVVGFRKLTI